ncbi:MAG: hypothetical protein IPK89_12715 [Sphingomonadales bacterium]|nr:hypothetical protein [Sphingomonadales bacterium]
MKTTENALAAILEESLYAVSANDEDITPRFLSGSLRCIPASAPTSFTPISPAGRW